VSAPEFSRPVRADTLGEAPRTIAIEATQEERTALARRLGLAAIGRLDAALALSRKGEEIAMRGTVRAAVTQICVATGAPIEAEVEAVADLTFRPQPATAADEEIELGAEELDVAFYDGAVVDAGEAAAETLSLALDPYPRAPDAEAALKAAGVKSEAEAGPAEAGPFAALAGLKGKLEDREGDPT
jgi:uncharacterized metal-binding protein YceD (DUF177 family)